MIVPTGVVEAGSAAVTAVGGRRASSEGSMGNMVDTASLPIHDFPCGIETNSNSPVNTGTVAADAQGESSSVSY